MMMVLGLGDGIGYTSLISKIHIHYTLVHTLVCAIRFPYDINLFIDISHYFEHILQ